MSFDMGFAIQWAQRIEKEERAFLTGAVNKQAKEEAERKSHRRRKHRSRTGSSCSRSEVSGTLSSAGASTLSGTSSSISRSSSEPSSMSRSTSEPTLVPEDRKAVMHFPVLDKDLITARVRPTNDGTIPAIKLSPEKKKAMWWPGRGSYTQYTPEFVFQPRPEWTPDDILKGAGMRR
eukprot:TRINITY_DN61276_c0_g1_i1.p1 TRINITY_DN61276_c0_g1~~TRINITY_DN61276_c0_g1_i1.p1  ORF type:complete len:177 (+),score=30.02 TRINITY_DN61276_c0_g1_i1:73-603(+)